ncbi:MAG: HPr(Ser) kinase/phosphatase [Candidatus Latescibacteria bacterium]|nr:HPr(Ser) kinase/phosphatase [Candidatus Latescibacterota bacterium]
MAQGISIRELLEEYGSRLALELVAGEKGLDRRLLNHEIHRPGLALTGFVELYTYDRLQVLGNTERLYLSHLSDEKRLAALRTMFQFDLPCVILTSGSIPSTVCREFSEERDIPLLVSRFSTTKFVHLFSYYLDDLFAPQSTMHACLVDVYGVGLLFTGRSGIGKSEIALDLVERGHRLVADDAVTIIRRARGVLMGIANEVVRHHLEIRGVGIVDVRRMFGIRAIRQRKRIEVEVQLVDWDKTKKYERVGLEDRLTSILDVEIPIVTVPIYPGKNITVISEVIALNHLLKTNGLHPAQAFNERLIQLMKEKRATGKAEEGNVG